MQDLNDLAYFVAVVQNKGFTAAARSTGVDKTKLSRRIAALERQLDVRLMQRNTRSVSLTAAGERFYNIAQSLVESATAAFETMADMRREPAGLVRLSCPQVMAQSYLAPILPGFMATYPKVQIELDASDRHVDLLRERYDLALRAHIRIDETAGLVAKELGRARRVLAASPALLDSLGRPAVPEELAGVASFARPGDMHDGQARWSLTDGSRTVSVTHVPRLVSDDLRLHLEGAVHGIGVALLPEPIVSASMGTGALEQVLPKWTAPTHIIHLLYPPPRGMLPSVRALIDHLTVYLPATIQERSVHVELT